MAAKLFYLPFPVAFTTRGVGAPSAKAYFYETGTTTPLATYTTDALTIEHPHPVVANASGRFPEIYLDNAVTARCIINDRDGAELCDIDPYVPGTAPDAGSLQPYADAAEASATNSSASASAASTSASTASTHATNAASSASSASTSASAAAASAVLADNAADAAIAAVSIPSAAIPAATRTALKNLATTAPGHLMESGRAGMFVFDSSNLSAEVTADSQEGIYVAPASGPTGASGAWVRQYDGHVDARWFGALGDDSTNNATALQKAYDWAAANDRSLYIPGGTYRIGAALNFNVANTQVVGDGWLKTIIKTTAATEAVIINANYSFIYGIGLDGALAGTQGFVCKSFGSGKIEWCDARNFDNDGLLFDPDYGGGLDGNNNLARVSNSSFNLNGRNGVRLTQHGDNNGIGFYGVNCSSNTSTGFLARSQGGYIDANCILEGNGAYGLQIGEDADTSTATDWLIDKPWAEANSSGDYRSSAQAGANTIVLKSAANSYSRHASASDTVVRNSSGLHQFASQDGDTFLQASGNSTSAYMLGFSRTGGNVNLVLGGAGTGNVQTQGALATGGALTVTGNASVTGDVKVNGNSGTARYFRWQTGGADSAASIALGGDNGTLFYAVGNTFSHKFQVAAVDIMAVSSTGLAVTGNVTVTDDAYAAGWNGSTAVPTKNAVYDKIEDILDGVTFTGAITVPADDFGADWNGSNAVPTKNDTYDGIVGLLSCYRTVLDSSGYLTAADAAATYGMAQGQKCAVSGTGTLYPLNTLYIAAADYPTVGGLAPRLRVRVELYCNDVAPGVTFTVGLHPVTRPGTSGAAGLCIYTIGSAVASSAIAITTPAADSSNTAVGAADISLPADGHYVLGVVTSGGALAASSHVHISARLQMRYT